MTGSPIDPTSPLFKAISIADAMAITGKSKRTIDRWIRDGHLRKVRLDGERTLIEEDVLDYEKRMWDNLSASRAVAPESVSPPT